MCAWRVDSVNGRARLVKDIARKYAASNREITCALGRVSGGFRPNPLVYKDLDAYVAAWRDAIVKELRAYKATADHSFSVVLGRCFHEARFLRGNGGKAAKTHPKARAHRSWRRNGCLFLIIWLSPQKRRARLRKGPIWAQPRLKPQRSFRNVQIASNM
jgi:hypothetical protein